MKKILTTSLLAAVTAVSAQAQTIWNGGNSTLWTDGANWSTNAEPVSASSTNVQFAGSNLTVSYNKTSALTVAGLTFNSGASAFQIAYGSGGNGTIRVGNTGVVNNSSNLQTIGVNLDFGTGNKLINAASGNITLSGNIIGSPTTLTKNGNYTLTLSGTTANFTVTGGTAITVTAGTLLVNTAMTCGTGANATVTVQGSGILGGSGSITGSVNYTSGSNSVFAGVIAGSGKTLTMNATGAILTLSGANSYNGTTMVSAGTLRYGGNAVISTGDVTISGGTLDMVSYTDSVGALSISANSTLKMAANQTGSAQLASTGAVGLAGTLDLTGMSTAAGLYKLVGGTSLTGMFATTTGLDGNYSLRYSANELDAQHKATIGTITANATNASIITGGNTTFTFTVANSAPTDSANLTFSAAAGNNTTGSVAGPVNVTAQATSGATSGLTFNGTTVGANMTGSFTVNDGNATNSGQAGTVTVNVYDHASGSVAGGVLTLGNIHAGYAGNATSSNSDSVSNAGGYRVDLQGSAAASGNISLNSVSGLTQNGTAGTIVATLAHGQGVGAISQNFTYTFADDSALSGASSNVGSAAISVTGQVYSGNMIWAGASGNFSAGANWNDASDSGVHVAPGLDAGFTGVDSATFGNTSGNVTVTLNGYNPSLNTITFNSAGSYTIDQGSGGNITLAGTSASITANGTHAIGAPITLTANTSMNVTAGSTLAVSGAVGETGGARSLTKDGAGTLALSGNNTYTGPTNVTAGTLLANNTSGSATGSGSVTVATGATLGGSGTVGGATTVQSGGTLSPGNSPGVETFTSGLTLEAGSVFTWQLTSNSTTGRGTNFDGVDVTGGNLTIGSGVTFNAVFNLAGSTVNFNDAFWQTNHSWLVFDNANAPAVGSPIFTLGTVSSDSFGNSLSGNLSFSQTGNDLYLDFSFMPPVPEPSTWIAMAALILTGGTIAMRRLASKHRAASGVIRGQLPDLRSMV